MDADAPQTESGRRHAPWHNSIGHPGGPGLADRGWARLRLLEGLGACDWSLSHHGEVGSRALVGAISGREGVGVLHLWAAVNDDAYGERLFRTRLRPAVVFGAHLEVRHSCQLELRGVAPTRSFEGSDVRVVVSFGPIRRVGHRETFSARNRHWDARNYGAGGEGRLVARHRPTADQALITDRRSTGAPAAACANCRYENWEGKLAQVRSDLMQASGRAWPQPVMPAIVVCHSRQCARLQPW